MRLPVKKLGRCMPASDVREDHEFLGNHVQGVTQLHSGRRDQDPTKDSPPTPTSFYQRREGLRCPRCDQSPNTDSCECRYSPTWLQRAPCNANAASALVTRSENVDTRPGVSRVGAPTSSVGALTRSRSLSAVAAKVTAPRTTAAVLSGKGRMRPVQIKRSSVSEKASQKATLSL